MNESPSTRPHTARPGDDPAERQRNAKRIARKIRFSPEEWERVRDRAIACGKAPARYVRDVALGSVPRPRSSVTNAPTVRELARIGNTLRTLLERSYQKTDGASTDPAGAGQSMEARLHEALAELLAVVRALG